MALFKILLVSIFTITVAQGLPTSGQEENGEYHVPTATFTQGLPAKEKRSPSKEEGGQTTGTENNNSNNQGQNCAGGFSSYIPSGVNGGSFVPSGGNGQLPGSQYLSFPPKHKRSPSKEEGGHATGAPSVENSGTENNNNNNQVQNCAGSFSSFIPGGGSGGSFVPSGGNGQLPGSQYLSFPPKHKRSPSKEEGGHGTGAPSVENSGTENNNNNNQVQNCAESFSSFIPGGGNGGSFVPSGGNGQLPGSQYLSFPPKHKRSPSKEEGDHATGAPSVENSGTENNNSNNQVQNCVGSFSSFIPGSGNGGSFVPSGGNGQLPGSQYLSFPPKHKRSPSKEEGDHATGAPSEENSGTENNNSNNQVQNCVGSFSSFIPGGGNGQLPGSQYLSFPPKHKRSPSKEEGGHATGAPSEENSGTENNNNNNQVQNCVGSFSSFIPGGGNGQLPGSQYLSFPPKHKRSPSKEEGDHATGAPSVENSGTENNNSNNQVQNCVGSFSSFIPGSGNGGSFVPSGGNGQLPGSQYLSFPPKHKRSPSKEEGDHATGAPSEENSGTENNNSNNQVQNCVGSFSSFIPGGGNGQLPGSQYLSFPPKHKRSPSKEEGGHATGAPNVENSGTENNNNNNQVQNCAGSFSSFIPGGGNGGSFVPSGGNGQLPGSQYLSFPPKHKRSPSKEEGGHATGAPSVENSGTENNNNNNQVQNCAGSFSSFIPGGGSGGSFVPSGGNGQLPGSQYLSFPPKHKRSPSKEEGGHATGAPSVENSGTENNNNNNQVQNCAGSFSSFIPGGGNGGSFVPSGGNGQLPGSQYLSFPPKHKRSPSKEEGGHATGAPSEENSGTENNNNNNQVQNCAGSFSSFIPGGGSGGSFVPSGGNGQLPGSQYLSFPPKHKRSPQIENRFDETSPFAFKRSPLDSTTHMRVSYLSYSKVP